MQVDSLSAKPLGKPRNTGVGSLCLLHWIFPTQGLSSSLLYCRRILYQRSYQGTKCHIIGIMWCVALSIGFFHFSSVQFSCSVMSDSLRPRESLSNMHLRFRHYFSWLDHFFLAWNKDPFYESWLLPSFGNCELSCHKQPYAGFCQLYTLS